MRSTLAKLSTAQVSGLTTTVFGTLTATQISTLTSTEIAKLTAGEIGQLSLDRAAEPDDDAGQCAHRHADRRAGQRR